MVVSTTVGFVPTLTTFGTIGVSFSVGLPSVTVPSSSFTILGVVVTILPSLPFDSTISVP